MANCHHTCHECEAWADIDSLRARFEASVERSDDGCWIWVGQKNPRGYGQMNVGRSPNYVHRVSVRLHGRDIPEGMEVDHLCRRTSCVNPEHLEVVTPRENRQRAARHRIKSGKTGASGIRGVTWHKGKQKWRVVIDGRQIGEYRTLDEARIAASPTY